MGSPSGADSFVIIPINGAFKMNSRKTSKFSVNKKIKITSGDGDYLTNLIRSNLKIEPDNII